MSDVALLVTAIAALLAAIGGIVAAVLAYHGRLIAASTKAEVKATKQELTVIHGEVREVGDRIDGRLTDLLTSTAALSRAEGIAAGEQAQRDRAADA